MSAQNPFEEWAIVELFGHQRIAGRVSEQTIGGCSFIRVDVPATENGPPFTKLYGNGAIYGLTLVDEQAARIAAAGCVATPVDRWSIQEYMKRIPAGPSQGDDHEDECDIPY